MNDPHVVALFYNIEHGPSVDYREAEPRDYEEENFSVQIEDRKICFAMKVHYATEEDAREAVREYISRWEFDGGLRRGPDRFKLVYQNARIVDRNPSPTPDGSVRLSTTFRLGAGTGSAMLTLLSQYPTPPSVGLTITPDVQSMFDRFMGYRSGREPLPSMAYFCLTVFEASAGQNTSRRKVAAKKYGVSQKMLEKIGYLSANSGGPQARKASGLGQALTNEDQRFLREAVAAIIRRVAEAAYDPAKNTPEISMSDFPYM